jgi:cytochrome c-type biogenesis protein
MALKMLLSFAAGLAGFLSPCVLPLLPGYVGFMTGATVGERVPMRRALPGTLAFVGGLAFVFVSLGAGASTISVVLNEHKRVLELVSGSFIVLLGAFMLWGSRFRVGLLERRFHIRPGRGPARTFLLGAAFAFGWTPCIGPILAGILAIAATQDTVGNGVRLLSAYSLGLAVPFFATALAINRFFAAFAKIRRHYHKIELASGALLIVIGVLIFTNRFTILAQWLTPYLPVY